jgi:hypothetical protein
MNVIEELKKIIKENKEIEDIIKEAINKIEIRQNNNYISKRFLIKN